MLVKKELLNRLKDFGLNSYESKLWTALLSRNVSTAGELSDISNVPRSRAYDVLESLEKKGFIIVKLGKPIKYSAVSPHEVVERVKKKLVKETNEKTEILDKLKESDLLEELNNLHDKGVEIIDPTDRSGAFRGRDKLYDHLSSLFKQAKSNITIMTTEDGLTRKYSRFQNDLEKAKKRGVKIRIATKTTDKNKQAIKELSKTAEIRNTDKESRYAIIDNTELVIMLVNDKEVHENYDSGIWVNSPYFVKHLQNMFDSEWKNMKRI